MSQRTALFAQHEAAGAKFVDFAGWDMPIHYGSQLEEHHAVRQGAGMFDVSHMTPVDVRGDGATAWLRHLLANDVAKLKKYLLLTIMGGAAFLGMQAYEYTHFFTNTHAAEGETAFRLFRPDSDTPFVLRPGDEVQFVETPPEQLANMEKDPDGGAEWERIP